MQQPTTLQCVQENSATIACLTLSNFRDHVEPIISDPFIIKTAILFDRRGKPEALS